MYKKSAFTLAEVLITLGIIGVVAAMSIPSLIANTNSAKFSSQFKKSIATLNQAALMSQSKYDFDFAGASSACGDDASDNPNSVASVCALLNGTLAGVTPDVNLTGYTLSQRIATPSIVKTEGMVGYKMADGSMFVFPKAAKTGCALDPGTVLDDYIYDLIDGGCYGFIDVNGKSMPNAEVNCGMAARTSLRPSSPCLVQKNATQMTDIYPVVYHDGVMEAATNAGSSVLRGGGENRPEPLELFK